MKRFLSLLLVMCVCLSVCSVNVFAVDDIIAPGFPSDDEVKIPEKPEDMPMGDEVSIPEKPEDMPKDDVSIPEKPGTIVAPGYPSDEELSIPKRPDVCIEIFEPFDDVAPSDYYYDAVMWAVDNGITKGTSATTFSPDDTCTVTEILTFLYRAEGSPSPSGSYSWISDGEYYTDALNWLTDLRVIYKDDVSIDCTRLAAVNYMHSLKLELGDPSALSFKQYNNITDVESWLRTPVDWALSRGITKGTSDTTFSPDDICTRGQIVTFLYRAYAK